MARSRLDTVRGWILEPLPGLALASLLAFVALLPAEPLFNLPVILLAGLGLARLIARPSRIADRQTRVLGVLFLCTWLPMVASLPDAVNPAESLRKTATFVLFYLAGAYVVAAITRMRDLDRLLAGLLVLCTLCSVDAMWQFATGADLLGYPYRGGQLAGIFYPKLALGVVLASFAPLVFEATRRLCLRSGGAGLILVPYLLAIVLAGSRSAWVTLLAAVVGYGVYLGWWFEWSRPRPRWGVGVLIAAVLAGVAAPYVTPRLTGKFTAVVVPRITQLPDLVSGDREQVDAALSYRLSIWETGGNMIADNWVNGVGPRGFRYAYPRYAPEHDYFTRIDPELAPTHPHLLIMEIAAETGLIGLIGYVILVVYLIGRIVKLGMTRSRPVLPFALGLLVALLPINVHVGFYGNFASSMIWWSAIVAVAALGVSEQHGEGLTRPRSRVSQTR